MAVLKSLELEGNKLSFANWISNLSPTCTPFTCMIGKEKIDQTQYEWQTDTLAPASAETFEEGSQAHSQPRATTKVLTNFTTTLRRAVNVSDTNQAVKAYGRNDEMRYQLGKAGKELMRDLEFANLSKTVGNIGDSTNASQYSGFKALVAEVNVPDPDTKAVVHLETPFMEGSRDAVLLKELFKITNNLFISGSKADKIMFHPKHMFIFNDYIGYNDEEPHIHRMFDGLDTRYNALITKIKDPLGRVYSLIPNRFMPQDEFYIFNEKDWTQMILRSPQRIQIGKTGPSKTIMVETEVGLRHRHPYASGILSLVTVNKTAEIIPEKSVLTAYTGDQTEATLIVLDTLGNPVADIAIEWESSDDTILEVQAQSDVTDASGVAEAILVPVKPGHVTIRAKGDQMLSEPVSIEVVGPTVVNSFDSFGMEMGERIHCITDVFNAEGTPAEDGTKVTLHANSGNVFFLTDPADVTSWVTEKDTEKGKIDTYIACEAPGTYRVWTSVHGVNSAYRTIYVGSAQLQIGWVQKMDDMALGLDRDVPFEVVIRNKVGDLINADAKVHWLVDNPKILTLSATESMTDTQGEAKITITPAGIGTANLRVHCYGDEISIPITVHPMDVDTVLIPENIPLIAGATKYEADLQTYVNDVEGNPLDDVIVSWVASPSNLVELTSIQAVTAGGVATTKVKGMAKGHGTIVATVNGMAGTPIKFSVGQGGVLTFHIDPNPTQVGQETVMSGTLRSDSGLAIPDVDITFFIEQAPHPQIPKTTTSATGTFEERFTPLVSGDVTVDAICASLQNAVKVNLGINT